MDNATSLSLARIAIGAAAWAAPELSLRAGMLDAHAPESPYLLRLFGARDVALGAVTLFAAPEHKPALLRVGLAVDAADAGAAVMALRSRRLSTRTGAVLTGAAGAAMVAGLVALGQQRALRKV
jgi:hypothetical protein